MSFDFDHTVQLYHAGKKAADAMEAGRDLPGEKFFISNYVPVFDPPELPEIPEDRLPLSPKAGGSAQRMGYRNRSADGMPSLEALMDALHTVAIPNYEDKGGRGKSYIFGPSLNSSLLPKLFQVRREIAGGHFKWGDKVLVSTPIYGMLPKIAYEAALEEHPDARAFLIVNPNNPTGTILSQPEVDAIGEVIEGYNAKRRQYSERELIVIEDTTFSGVRWERSSEWPSTLEDRKAMGSFLDYRGTKDSTISLHSWSKDLSPELGLASAVGNPALLDGMRLDDGPTKHAQEYALKAIHPFNKSITIAHAKKSVEFYKHDYEIIKDRIACLNTVLQEKMGDNRQYVTIVTEPGAGFNVTADFRGLAGFSLPAESEKTEVPPLSTSLDFTLALMKNTNVIAYPGEMFYIPAEDMAVRFSLNVEEEKLNKAFDRIEQFVLSLEPPSKWRDRDIQRKQDAVGNSSFPAH